MKNLNKKFVIISIIVALLVVGAITLSSYAYFSIANGTGTESVITSGNMALTLTDGAVVTTGNMIPGEYIEKEFSVENTGNVTSSYDVYLSEVINTFADKTDFVYEISSLDGGYNTPSQVQLPSVSTKIVNQQAIGVGVTHHYKLKITFLAKNENQDDNQGKVFSAKIQVNEYRDKYIITYDVNGGNDLDNTTATILSGDSINMPTPTKENSFFVGWYTQATGGDLISSTSSINSSITLYAHYGYYTVNYYANGGTGSMTSSTGTDIEISNNSFTAPTGKKFAGWNTLSNGSGTEYTEGQVVNANINLYAIWKTDLKLANGTSLNVTKTNEALKNYYGNTVASSFFSSNEGADWVWQLFYDDEDYVFLIASDYVPNSKLPAEGNPGYGNTDLFKSTDSTNNYSSYCAGFTTNNGNYVYSNNNLASLANNRLTSKYLKFYGLYPNNNRGNMKATRFMMDTSKWSSFAGTKYNTAEAIGGPTIELFVKSWNAAPAHVNDQLWSYDTMTYNTNYNDNGYKIYNSATDTWGYEVYKNYVNNITNMWFISENTKAQGPWISSPNNVNEWSIICIYRAHGFHSGGGTATTEGFRPIVSISKSEIM